MITYEEFTKLQEAVKEAEKVDTPYMGIIDDEIQVVGDVNKTDVKPADYTVYFAFPDTKEWRDRAKVNNDKTIKEIDDYFVVERTYKNHHVSPRNAGNAVNAFVLIEAFLNKVTKDGEVEELSFDELQQLFVSLNHEIGDATYEVVSSVLRIPLDEVEWMLPMNTAENAIKIVNHNPSIVNEANLFFGLSPEKV